MATPVGRTSGGRVPNNPGPTGYWAQVIKGLKSVSKPNLGLTKKGTTPVTKLPTQKPNRKFSE